MVISFGSRIGAAQQFSENPGERGLPHPNDLLIGGVGGHVRDGGREQRRLLPLACQLSEAALVATDSTRTRTLPGGTVTFSSSRLPSAWTVPDVSTTAFVIFYPLGSVSAYDGFFSS